MTDAEWRMANAEWQMPKAGGRFGFGFGLRAAGIVLFVIVATANSAGYRYGASDQAFYIPAVLRHLDPALFPRDAPLIDSQARLTIVDEALAAVVRGTGSSLPWLFLLLYVLTLALLLLGAWRLARHFVRNPWTFAALAAALALRHAIAKTGANTLEGYFHPRQLAFALGVWATACFLEKRSRTAMVVLAAALIIHSTTAAWFVALLAGAAIDRRFGWRASFAAVAAAALVAWIGAFWILAARFPRMDPAWLAVIGDKDYLFPFRWPPDAWLTNLLPLPVIVVAWYVRRRTGREVEGERSLVVGALGLAAAFAAWLPLDHARVALAVQLQVSRVFWVLDFMATIYLVWALCEWRPSRNRAVIAAAALALAATARGVYTLTVQFPDRALFAVHIEHQDWRNAMRWARTTAPTSGWLADPMHAARYGSSLRAAGERDVFLERLKDTAIAMYDRDIAMRVADREHAIEAHPWNTADGARSLARMYDLDYLIIDRELPLPPVYRAGSLVVYRLR